MQVTVGDRMSTQFTLVAGEASLDDTRMPDGNYVVILDRDGAPVALVLPDQLQDAVARGATKLLDPAAGLPATLVVRRGLELSELVNTPAVLMLRDAAIGAVVLDDSTDEIVGVLPVGALDTFLGSGEFTPPPTVLGWSGLSNDPRLPGRIDVPLARVMCSTCGFVNTLEFFDASSPPTCQNPNGMTHSLMAGA